MPLRGIRYFGAATDFARAACLRLNEARLRIRRVPPNYAYRACLREGETAIDVGVGPDPDFSKHLMATHGLECYAVDPTRKHAEALKEMERNEPLFHYLPYALGASPGRVMFYESAVNVSGSVMPRHRNVVNDPVSSYCVEMVCLAQLLELVGRPTIAIMKVDLEGAEYEWIETLDLPVFKRIRQLIVEFHHEIVGGIKWSDSERAIARIKSSGMKAFVYNGRDCLFYW